MNLSDILIEETISLHLSGRTKTEVIREMAELASRSGKVESTETLVKAISERESLQSTGIGHGVAIPHATADGITDLVLALGIVKPGIDYDSLDKEPVQLIFCLAGAPRYQTTFLSILSKIFRIFRKKEMREKVLAAQNAEEILSLIETREEM